MNPNRIFRRAAIERISSPEQLDTLMRIISPAGWLALWTTFAMLAVALVWGFLGRIPTEVVGEGVLLRTGGMMLVESSVSGLIEDLSVDTGDLIEPGQVIARVSKQELREQLRQAQQRLEDTKLRRSKSLDLLDQNAGATRETLDYRLAAAEATLESRRLEVERRQSKLERTERLAEQGVISTDTAAEASSALEQARAALVQATYDLERIRSDRVASTMSDSSERQALDQELLLAEQQVHLLQEELLHESRLLATHTGKVVELMVSSGEPIQVGTPVIAIERTGRSVKDLEVISYVSSLDGRKIRPGMKAMVVPSVVKKEEYGSLQAIVVEVGEVPAGEQDMMRVLGNPALVGRMASRELPIELRVDLVPDPRTPSGYRWTSHQGAPLRLQSGTLCDVSVVVRERPPIALLIPRLEKVIGL